MEDLRYDMHVTSVIVIDIYIQKNIRTKHKIQGFVTLVIVKITRIILNNIESFGEILSLFFVK